ncbi:MAG: zf-HC2 domain-containing protein, partial [Armatimonadota bacterium]
MKCPPEIELNEFAEDRLESRRRWEIQEHLDQCTDCRTDLEGLQWVGGPLALLDLLTEAEGMDHPSDADLAALAEGSMDADRKAELLSHLGVCAECARLFGALPRPQRKTVTRRNFYGFAAAAALLLCLGLFAFTGKFADPKQAGTPVAKA